MQIFELDSLPIAQVGDLDPFELRLGAFFAERPFAMRAIAHSGPFAMDAPIAHVRRQIHGLEGPYLRSAALRAALTAWAVATDPAARPLPRADDPPAQLADGAAAPDADALARVAATAATALAAARAALPPSLAAELTALLGPLPALVAPDHAGPAAWQALLTALDQRFWRVPWASAAAQMYQTMERQILRAAQYLLITWEPPSVSEAALRIPLAMATGRPVRRVTHLPPILAGPYQEQLRCLAPLTPGQPFLAVLTSYDAVGVWDATLLHELIALNQDLTIAIEIRTMPRPKAQRTAELAYNAATLVARDPSLVDTRGEQVVRDARLVLSELKHQTLHQIQVAILVRGRERAELEANVATVRDLLGARLKLLRPVGAQGPALQLFSTTPFAHIAAPWKPRTQLSQAVGCLAGVIGFHRPRQTRGLFLGVERTSRVPIFIDLFARNQAAHMILAGMSGSGKTVLLNLLAERAATLGDMQVIGIDAFANGARVERAIADCSCVRIGMEHTINVLDVIYGWEMAGGWEHNQVLHVVSQLAALLGTPGLSADNRQQVQPRVFRSDERGVLARAVQTLYARYRITPDTPVTAMPTLQELIAVLAGERDPIAERFARQLRYLLYGTQQATDRATPDGRAFVGQTTIDWQFQRRICYFDLMGVPEVLQGLYYGQVLAGVWRYARTRREWRSLFLMMDEFGHASQVEAVLQAAWVFAKTARKYGLGLLLVDQTMRPFLEHPRMRELHANAAAHGFFRMQASEAQAVAQAMPILGARGRQFLSDAEPGQCLAVIRKDVYEVNVECHPLEARAFVA